METETSRVDPENVEVMDLGESGENNKRAADACIWFDLLPDRRLLDPNFDGYKLALDAFTRYELAPQDNGYDLDAALAHLRDVCRVPIVTGLPFGHVRDKLTLPVGGRARLAVRGGEATLAMEDGR